jgi:hypothetical protein
LDDSCKKQRCEVAEDVGGVKEMGIVIERFGDERLLRILSERVFSRYEETAVEIETELLVGAATDCGLIQTCLEVELH